MIRLQRTGRKHEPVFRVVVTDSKTGPKSGKHIEILGSYDARQKNRATVKADRVKHWISQGAQVSDTVHNVLVDQGIIEGSKKNALPKKTPIVKEPTEEELAAEAAAKEAAEAPKEEAPVEEEKTEEVPAEEDPKEEVAEEAPKEEEVVEEEKTEETPAEETPKEEVVEEAAEEPKEEAPVEEEKTEA